MKRLTYLIAILMAINTLHAVAEWVDPNDEFSPIRMAPYLMDGNCFYRHVGNDTDELVLFDPSDEDGCESSSYQLWSNTEFPSNVMDNGILKPVIGIADGCFNYGFSTDIDITFPETIEFIGDRVFNSFDVGSISFASNPRIIGNSCFNNCENLKSLNLPAKLYKIGDYCFGDLSIESLDLPASLSHIGNDCFQYCYNIREIKLPSGLNKLGAGCFKHCTNLESVSLPKYLSLKNCFNECVAIKLIICEDECPNSVSSSFDSVDKANCKVIVPVGALSAYQNHPFWKEFFMEEDKTTIIEEVDLENIPENPIMFDLNGFQIKEESSVRPGTIIINHNDKQAIKSIKL